MTVVPKGKIWKADVNDGILWMSLKPLSACVYVYNPLVCLYNDVVRLPIDSAFELSADVVRPDDAQGTRQRMHQCAFLLCIVQQSIL